MAEDRTELEKEYFAYLLQERLPFPDGYYVENDRFYFSLPPSDNCKWNNKTRTWIDLTTKNEQLEYLKNEILKNTRELLVYKEAGFSNDELQAKIDELVEKHRILSEEIAREDNKLY